MPANRRDRGRRLRSRGHACRAQGARRRPHGDRGRDVRGRRRHPRPVAGASRCRVGVNRGTRPGTAAPDPVGRRRRAAAGAAPRARGHDGRQGDHARAADPRRAVLAQPVRPDRGDHLAHSLRLDRLLPARCEGQSAPAARRLARGGRDADVVAGRDRLVERAREPALARHARAARRGARSARGRDRSDHGRERGSSAATRWSPRSPGERCSSTCRS